MAAASLVSQLASLATNALAHRSRAVVATSLPTAGLRARVVLSRRRRRLLERQAARNPPRAAANRFGTMPHVAAYGILLVQALFFFLGGRGSAAITIITIMR